MSTLHFAILYVCSHFLYCGLTVTLYDQVSASIWPRDGLIRKSFLTQDSGSSLLIGSSITIRLSISARLADTRQIVAYFQANLQDTANLNHTDCI